MFVTTDGTPLLIEVPGPSILHRPANSVILALGPWKRAGYRLEEKEGTADNPRDGGYLVTPDGQRITLEFEDDLWHLPLYAQPTSTARPPVSARPTPPPAASRSARTANPFAVLTDDETSAPPCYPVPFTARWTTEDIAESHDAWCHPGHSVYDAITQEYPDLFPKDPKYRAAARQHACPVCTLMKGARAYRKSKRMKEKERKGRRRAPPDPSPPLTSAAAATSPTPPEARRKIRFAPDTKDVTRLGRDDFLHAL